MLEAQRQFVANASHQLRTPLTGLMLRLEAASLKAGPELAAELEAAEREVARLARLLTTLLALAREGDRPAPRPVVLAEAAGEARERWSDRAAQTGHELELDCRENAVALASEEDVAIVLDNLIENALKYSGDGGTVRVECARDGAEVWLAVLDEGPGLASGRGAAHLRAVRARQRRRPRSGNRARAGARRDAGAPLGRLRRRSGTACTAAPGPRSAYLRPTSLCRSRTRTWTRLYPAASSLEPCDSDC